jgi:hypothetical protein
MMNLSSGEKATVQMSTGPTSMLPTFAPDARSHSLKLESNELEAQAENIYSYLWNMHCISAH